jgi:hypothetical protein
MPEPRSLAQRCEVKTVSGERCPEVAEYVLTCGDDSANVCDRCLSGWVHHLTRRGPISIERIPTHSGREQADV